MDEIAELLKHAESPSERATLLVLHKIATKLGDIDKDFTEHRREFNEHREEFRSHVAEEQKLLARGLGAWMILSGALAIGASAGAWYVGAHITDVNKVQQVVIDLNSNRLTAIEQQLRDLVTQRAAPK